VNRGRLLAATIASLASMGATASASDPIITPAPLAQEGCVSPQGDTCTYTATRPGGHAAAGSNWTLVISIPANGDPRDTNLDGRLTYTITPANGLPQGCGLFDPGATITTTAGASSGLAAGSPFPQPTDSVTGTANDCEGGKLPARTDVTPQ
jgi:hypothetical protein